MSGTRYRFQRCLGRGGFGEVYLATRIPESGNERQVAVKVLRPDLDNLEQAIKRLKDEARALAVLDHPAVLKVIELTRFDNRVALVTEYVDGWDLARFARAAPRLPERIVLTVMAEVAHALDVALTMPSPETGNPLGLVHRDIKPENIRLSKHGEVKLLDFGIARSDELGREARTATGHMSFTPGYTAPESFLSLSQDARSDVFALGATVYRLLTGERFFEGVKLSQQAALSTSQRRFDAYVGERVAKIARVHADLRPLVAACLGWDPDGRPSASEVARRAQRIADAVPGPTLHGWARDAPAVTENDVPNAPLTGRVVEEDDPTTVVAFAPWPLPPPVPDGLVPISPTLATEHTPAPRTREAAAPPRGPSTVLVVLAGLLLGGLLALALVGVATGIAWVTM